MEELECQAELEERNLFSICQVKGKGKDLCKYFDGKGERCFFYYTAHEHCGCAQAQNEALKNRR